MQPVPIKERGHIVQDFFWLIAGRMIEGFEGGAPHRNLETSQALRAFHRARRNALVRRLKAALPRRRTMGRDRFALGGNAELAIDDIALAILEGKAVALPRLPLSCAGLWVSSYERFARGEPGFSSFDVALSSGRPAIGGGMDALIRLEILRNAGERMVVAKLKPAATGSARAAAFMAEPVSARPVGRGREERARRAAS
jgi:hypothetical protein